MKTTGDSPNQGSKWLLWVGLAVLLGAFCLQHFAVFGNLLRRWQKDFEYCYLVPFMFVYLIYSNRESLRQLKPRSSLWGLLLVVFSGLLYLTGQLGSIETLTYVGIWIGVVGLSLLLLGTDLTKAMAFPFLILAFIVPLPPFLNRAFTFKLKLISSALSVKILQLMGLSAYREGNIIDLGMTQLQVVDACSGLRYVYPLLLMSFLFGYFFNKTWWERLIIILAAPPISVFSNALRIAMTGYLSSRVSPKMADTFFHGFSGWLIFVVSLVLLSCLSWFLRVIQSRVRKKTPSRLSRKSSPGRFSLGGVKPSYLWVGSALFFVFWGLNTSLTSAIDTPPRKSFVEFPGVIGDWRGEKTVLREEVLDQLWADDYVQIRFVHPGTGDVLLLFIPYYKRQGTRHTAHSPLSCLVGGGYAPRSRKSITRELPPPFGQVEIRQMVLEKDGERLLSNYWFQQRGRILAGEYANKWYLFWDSVTRRRTDGGLVRLEMPLRQDQDVREAQAVMDEFTLELARILPEYVPN